MSWWKKAVFVASYALYKLALLWEIRSPKRAMIGFEARYSLSNLFHTLLPGRTRQPVLYTGPGRIETRLGTFEVRPGTQDAAIVSPAFERLDWNLFRRKIREEITTGNQIWFVDAGANIGTFSVRAALSFPTLKVWSVEPAPDNLRLLRANIGVNGLQEDRVTVLPFAGSSAAGRLRLEFHRLQPGDSHLSTGSHQRGVEVQGAPLDQILPEPRPGTTLILKADVEGHERELLTGAHKLLKTVDRCWLWVEDIHDRPGLYEFLRGAGFTFADKRTPYNSWWLKK